MELLHHYCPTATFQSIISSGSVWLSAMTQSSDSREGKLVSAAVARMAEQDGLPKDEIEKILSAVALLEDSTEALGFCLSSADDLLSQWRGYASDGSGFSIGFRPEYVSWLRDSEVSGDRDFQLALGTVKYEASEHDLQVELLYRNMKSVVQSPKAMFLKAAEGLRKQSLRTASPSHHPVGQLWESFIAQPDDDELAMAKDLKNHLEAAALRSLPTWFMLKHSAFREELETRLIWLASHPLPATCEYRCRDNELVPYRVLALHRHKDPIAQVRLGPKNRTPVRVVSAFLEKSGFKNVEVLRSSASYR